MGLGMDMVMERPKVLAMIGINDMRGGMQK